jgi:hypothetical protein
MKQSYFSRFFEWQNYIHYVLNGVFLFAEVYFLKIYNLDYLMMFLSTTGLIFLNDSIIHLLFYYLPRPIQWRD